MKTLFAHTKQKSCIAAILLGPLAAYQLFLLLRQVQNLQKLLDLKNSFSGLGDSLGGLGKLLGGLTDKVQVPVPFYVDLVLQLAGVLLVLLIYAKLLLPVGEHRPVLGALLGLYVAQSIWQALNANALLKSDSLIFLVLDQHAPLTAMSVVAILVTPYLVLLAGVIAGRGGIGFRIAAALTSVAAGGYQFIAGVRLNGDERDLPGIFLGLAAALLLAAVLLLHPVPERPLRKRPWERYPWEIPAKPQRKK
jgi:hypothetical protein